ncbi:MAG: hypothetical protein CMP36_01095 [Rickettsiales bacterium]|nr:hypothetical protein [Rickettsiales bacterium]OUV82545.1 MAG: hypothetical protein CBC91_01515 [Rickettsiales bacterium TMED131]|tara:strand:- start:23 stop:229 length:207 start_codon:yes stop_codon:yes gene_type:complete
MLTNWLFWAIPRNYVRRYLLTFWLVMFFIPGYFLGLQFTKLGFIINWLWFDLVFYGWYRAKQMIGDDE